MSGSQYSDVDVDLRTLFSSLARNWFRILLWSLALTALAFAFAWIATPKYEAETRILIETRESIFTRPEARDQQPSSILDEEGVTSQVEIISSTEILKQVAQKLDLAKLPEFDEAADMSVIDRLLVVAGLKTDPSAIPPEERVLKRFREKLEVYRVEKSRVIVVHFSSEDPKLAAQIPNEIADAYISVSRAAKLDSNTDATSWLQPEIADLTKRVKEAEAKVADFRAKSDLLMGRDQSLLATQQLSELSSELSRVRANRAAAEATADGVRAALRNGASIDSLPSVLQSPLIQRLREREVQLKADIADLSTTLLDNHPRIRALNSQLADLEMQISGEAQNVLRSLSTEAETARARETQLVADLNRLKVESARAGDEDVELRALEREAAAQRELLESYLTRYREASSRGDRNYLPADARVFSRATVPSEPYFPKIAPIVIAAFVGSLLLMTVITLLRELFSGNAMRYPVSSHNVYREQSVAPSTGGDADILPGHAGPSEYPATGHEGAQVGLNVPEVVEKLIAEGATRAIFVSPEGDEGAASSITAAREAADAGLRILLLDLTESGAASRPMLEDFGRPGITNLLCAQAQFADVIHSDHFSDCHLIPVGTADPAKAMRAVDRLPIILQSLGTVYDLIVIECGAATAAAIRRLVTDGTMIFVSAVTLSGGRVAPVLDDLRSAGYESFLVTPGAVLKPPSPARTAA
jgi:uncharacterized protein involved in exopolysaccharide biosynthesis/Mrp family chromosome partitioning ATPase